MSAVWPVMSDWFVVDGGRFNDRGGTHKGYDLAIPIGTSIYPVLPGSVVKAGWDDTGYGNMVKLKHDGGYTSIYAHLSLINVSIGDTVKQGELIGLSGSTGNSTGPHLHLEIRKDNVPIDPQIFITGGMTDSTPDPGNEPARIAHTPVSMVGMVNKDEVKEFLRIRSGPGIEFDEIGRYTPGDTVTIVGIASPEVWVKTDTGYCAAVYNGVTLVRLEGKGDE